MAGAHPCYSSEPANAGSRPSRHCFPQPDRITLSSDTGAVNPTSNVGFTYDPAFPRLKTLTDGPGPTT